MTQDAIAIPFGYVDVTTGKWHHNPNLKMTREEQRQHNEKYGYYTDAMQRKHTFRIGNTLFSNLSDEQYSFVCEQQLSNFKRMSAANPRGPAHARHKDPIS